jgi:formylglycine-generating enzyme required for sulfatase activity
MQHQVSNADYQRCVDAQTCTALPAASPTEIGDPAVGVSFQDADTYAQWLSKTTSMIWRLPTDREWAFAAGSLYNATDESFTKTK